MNTEAAALIALARANIPPDVQELLVRGDAMRGIAPGALTALIKAVDAMRSDEKRRNCHHQNRHSQGSIGSDGSSNISWYCLDCGDSGSSRTGPRQPG